MADPAYLGGMPVDFHTREFETELAVKTLGCQWEQWTFPDDDPDWDEVEQQMRTLDDEVLDPPWDTVFVPQWEENGHVHHNMIWGIAVRVFGGRVSPYLTYTTGGKSRWGNEVEFEPEWIALKHHALACYKSQAAHPATRAHFLDDIREYVA